MISSRPFLGFLALACLVLPTSQTMAETFYLADGTTIEGTVVRKLGPLVSIKLSGAGIARIKLDDIERVEFETPEGDRVSARIAGWSRGIYELVTDQGTIRASAEQGRLVALSDPDPAAQDSRTQQRDAVAAQTPPEPSVAPETETPELIKAGFVYVGLADDGGRNFMIDKGRQRLEDNPKIAETTVFEIESSGDDQVIDAIEQLVADGANMIFVTEGTASAAVAESATRHADVTFVYCGPFDQALNMNVFCGRIYEARYLSGIVAGGMTETDLIGYVAAEPTTDTIVGINAFALGVQSVNANAEIIVHWTGSSYAPGNAQQRADELAERGVDVLTIHQDSPAALQAAERRGISTIGFQSDMSAFAPSNILTSAVWDWGKMYDQIVDQVNGGDAQLRPTWLGLREGVVDLAPISNRVPEDLQRLVQQRQREMIEGRFNVFTGPIRDVDGDVRILDGRVITDESLQKMDYLIDGVAGY